MSFASYINSPKWLKKKKGLFIYFWLPWVFGSMHGQSLAVEGEFHGPLMVMAPPTGE